MQMAVSAAPSSSARGLPRKKSNQRTPPLLGLIILAILNHNLPISALPQVGRGSTAAKPDDRVRDARKHSSITHST
jgi:hypothetical protein